MEYLLPMALSILLESIKNPTKAQALKRQMAKLYKAIVMTYAGDVAFWSMTGFKEPES